MNLPELPPLKDDNKNDKLEKTIKINGPPDEYASMKLPDLTSNLSSESQGNEVNKGEVPLINPFENIEVNFDKNNFNEELKFDDIPLNTKNKDNKKEDINYEKTDGFYFDDILTTEASSINKQFDDIPINTDNSTKVDNLINNSDDKIIHHSKIINDDHLNSEELPKKSKSTPNPLKTTDSSKATFPRPGKHLKSSLPKETTDDSIINYTKANIANTTDIDGEEESELTDKESNSKNDNLSSYSQQSEINLDNLGFTPETNKAENTQENTIDFNDNNDKNLTHNSNSNSKDFKEFDESKIIDFVDKVKMKAKTLKENLMSKLPLNKTNRLKIDKPKSSGAGFFTHIKPAYLAVCIIVIAAVLLSVFFITSKVKNKYKPLRDIEITIKEKDVLLKLSDFKEINNNNIEFNVKNLGEISSNYSIDINFKAKLGDFTCESDIIALEPDEVLTEVLKCDSFEQSDIYKTTYNYIEY